MSFKPLSSTEKLKKKGGEGRGKEGEGRGKEIVSKLSTLGNKFRDMLICHMRFFTELFQEYRKGSPVQNSYRRRKLVPQRTLNHKKLDQVG